MKIMRKLFYFTKNKCNNNDITSMDANKRGKI